jgi:hypothetical protein
MQERELIIDIEYEELDLDTELSGSPNPPQPQRARHVQRVPRREAPSLAEAAASAAAIGRSAAVQAYPAIEMLLITLGRLIWWIVQGIALLLSFLIMLIAQIFASAFQGLRSAPHRREEVQQHPGWSGPPKPTNTKGITIINNNFITNNIEK